MTVSPALRVRTFIAVPVPDEIKERAGRIQSPLKSSGADVKWVPPENFHFTLKFLGGVPAEELPRIAERTAEAVKGFRPFMVTLAGVGAFPRISRPRVVWLGVTEGSQELARLAESIENALAEAGYPREERPFSPHLTLGRIRPTGKLGSLISKLEESARAEAGRFRVDRVVLMRSDLRPTGPIYTPLEEFSLEEPSG